MSLDFNPGRFRACASESAATRASLGYPWMAEFHAGISPARGGFLSRSRRTGQAPQCEQQRVGRGRLPATSIPCDGLPVGLHLVSRALREIVP